MESISQQIINNMEQLKTSRVTTAKLDHPRIFPSYSYQDEKNILHLSFSDSDVDKIKKLEDSILICNFWYKAVDKIHQLGVVKDLFKKDNNISIELPANVGDITFCIFSYDKKSGKKLTSSNILLQEFKADGKTIVDEKKETHPWKIIVSKELLEPWRLDFNLNHKEFIIEVMSDQMLLAMQKDKGHNGYNFSMSISFLKIILQRSLYEYIYSQDQFEGSNIYETFHKIIQVLDSPEDSCPINNSSYGEQSVQYEDCLNWVDNVCGKYFITKNNQDQFNHFLNLVSYGEVTNG